MSSDHKGLNYDVVIIGAGINFAYRLQEKNPGLTYTILESRHEVGGTWSLFKYPGIRSDTDLYTFGFSWRIWEMSTRIAQGHLIRDYLNESAHENGIDKKIQCNRHVNAASWSSAQHEWALDVTGGEKERMVYRCRFLMLCTSYYDYKQPLNATIPGIEQFQKAVVHPQFWPEGLDYSDKHVVIVGSGATAITLLPALTDKASHVTMLQRSPSYLVAIPQQGSINRLIRKWCSVWVQDRLIWLHHMLTASFFAMIVYNFPFLVRKSFRDKTIAQLPLTVPYDPHFTPNYDIGKQRVCLSPDGDFFKALRSGKASIETGVIESITHDSIKLESGKELHPDLIVTATGLKLQFAGGMRITVDGEPYNPPEKYTWKGAMLQDLPNCGFVLGYADAAWTLGADATAQLITRIIKQMWREGVVEVRPYMTEEDRRSVRQRQLFRLGSTYITMGESALPKAGDRGQWNGRSFYLKDMAMAWFGDVRKGMVWVKGV
ncbi:hypothetical protein M409DRAFT_22768 [Zasmidium cellare ATCC 36951]|uniref:FAD/NAD(P)-binding domain-containing protein n=1 Tax=Zasmidium cellare ATCC 36951 TaxID=1080233 RepID=A0A6A6CLA4_ZASCE|nr:uncharacterized protein M409DRAFT_22768 [Zasmidium cellare ATCC 36951]KAF2166712.1 hypothetical protein M409DRAFT_22768 [Zasmidium cellare ATCC 36951]